MTSMIRLTLRLASLMALVSLGCGGGVGPKLVPAEGVLTLNGKPLVGATVVFHPENNKTQEGIGLTDDKGAFVVRTSTRAGAIPGKYKVTVEYYTKTDGAPLALSELERNQGLDVSQLIAMGKAKPGVPSKYTEVISSDVRIEIKPDAKESISIALAGQ